ncbi:hypothetical protein KFL_004620040 [Klebsormidium nitens]|uniref:F-box domain-containing protein n=1 Tax=Klebsormidium nitens TaxID=105231 RepID=A0A1Y1IE03_KLENI|nr:hypothetical protein KFL_004620040 [Klebsormidium nitens]|eukprot:GAQ88823.1 hypothetical protein KFL_004620040 [Klebsormidium nitens]
MGLWSSPNYGGPFDAAQANALRMETLHEPVFNKILDLLPLRDMCSLECVSKTLQRWVVTRHGQLWQGWCERACPSILVSPAKKIFSAQYKSYKHLFFRLQRADELVEERGKEEGRRVAEFNPLGLGAQNPELDDYVVLVDVSLGDEGILFQSADGKTVRLDRMVADSSGGKRYRGDCTGVCKPEAEARLCNALQALVERTDGEELFCKLRLMHKAKPEFVVVMKRIAINDVSHQLLDPPKFNFVQHNFYLDMDWSDSRAGKPVKKGRDSKVKINDVLLRVKYFFAKGVDARKEKLSEAMSREYSFTIQFSSLS